MEAQGKRLLTKTVDYVAAHEPEKLFAVIPRGSEVCDGFQRLSVRDLARAVNSLSWWIEDTIGKGNSRETLTYMGANDVRYFFFLLACQKTGYQAFFTSTRNSDEAHVHLLKATNSTKVFFSEERHSQILEIQGLCPNVAIFQIPTVKATLGDERGLRPYSVAKSYSDAENEIACLIHSSGTTGLPKPVSLTNGFFGAFDAIPLLSWPTGRQPSLFFQLTNNDLVLATTPFFHLMGLISFFLAIFHGVPILIGPDKPLSVEHLVDLINETHPKGAVFPPSILEDMSHSEKALASLKSLQFVSFGGAPLAPDTGDRLRKHTQLISIIGTSEIGWIPALVPEDEADWAYFEWNTAYGIRMQDTGDGLYEMTLPRLSNSREIQGIFHTFPDIDLYRTNDLYTQHPRNPNLWKYYGRQDDVIVLSNGEKFNPVTMETIIEGHPLLSGAIVVGQSRFQAALLVEPNPNAPDMDSKLFIEAIWPTVQAANQTIAAHGRVMKSKIGLAKKTKPFKRTPKGSVQRRAVLRDYEKEINEIYEAGLEEDLNHVLPETLDQAGITEYTRQTIARALEKPDVPIEQDLYSTGLDSLMTIQVARILQKGVQQRRPEVKAGVITPQTIYANPTVKRLAEFIFGIIEGKAQAGISRDEKVRRLVEKYTADLPPRNNTSQKELSSPSTVILTGSTGSLGTYLLHDLLNTPSVTKIYCLNRSDAEGRQMKGLEEKGLHFDASRWVDKVEFLQASFGEPRFGLDESKFQELLDSVDTIIHNAWKVDFNHSIESFEDTHIRGIRHFVDFSLKSKHYAHIHFVSSVSTVGAWTPEMGSLVPEVPMEDSAVVLPQGYGESKHTAERICLEASRRSHVPTTIYRVGQIAGPTTLSGQWNPHEWLPTIIATSKAIGKIPNRLGSISVDWVPVDILSKIMVEIVHTRHGDRSELPTAVFHLTNSVTAPWSTLIPAIQSKYEVESVEFTSWLAELESIENPTSTDVAEKPALKLLSFYRGLVDEKNSKMSVALDVQKAKEASGTMRSLGPISPALMTNWLDQWSF
ncbi:acetyl-CoA synthetase-like protein [Penicillium canariense]|uniref:Acetyl-CoA synthetase-like protein n=1 Tax=Penicillium canariense TaxID=189055 RepID=A0A9W9HWX2_9EURO|nr:acetyl-CoA synthetase-like protein [Penicillium canariense]KAJ5157506.1 acetyl-CoA synthetase-like protein [Penicillium canariense]